MFTNIIPHDLVQTTHENRNSFECYLAFKEAGKPADYPLYYGGNYEQCKAVMKQVYCCKYFYPDNTPTVDGKFISFVVFYDVANGHKLNRVEF